MTCFTDAEAKQNFDAVLDRAQAEGEVLIKCTNGRQFIVSLVPSEGPRPVPESADDVGGSIRLDLQCAECDYNLRGLALDRACPECGKPVPETVWAVVSGTVMCPAEHVQQVHEAALELASAASGYPKDAFLSVIDVISTSPTVGKHIGAREICGLFREYVVEYFNDADEAVDLLGEWKLKGSEDVGAVIYAMVRAGLLLDSSTDKPEGFRGLFTLDTLFDKQQ